MVTGYEGAVVTETENTSSLNTMNQKVKKNEGFYRKASRRPLCRLCTNDVDRLRVDHDVGDWNRRRWEPGRPNQRRNQTQKHDGGVDHSSLLRNVFRNKFMSRRIYIS